ETEAWGCEEQEEEPKEDVALQEEVDAESPEGGKPAAATPDGHDKLEVLREQWESCLGEWKKSEIFMSIQKSSAERRKGKRVWATRAAIVEKYKSEEVADRIIAQKMSNEETRKTQVKAHPDDPDNKDLMLYLIWDSEEETSEEDVVMTQLFQAVDSDDPEASESPKNGKKKSKKKSSSSEEDLVPSILETDRYSSTIPSTQLVPKSSMPLHQDSSSESSSKKKKKKSKGKKKGKKGKKGKKETKEQRDKRIKREQEIQLKEQQRETEKSKKAQVSKAKKALTSVNDTIRKGREKLTRVSKLTKALRDAIEDDLQAVYDGMVAERDGLQQAIDSHEDVSGFRLRAFISPSLGFQELRGSMIPHLRDPGVVNGLGEIRCRLACVYYTWDTGLKCLEVTRAEMDDAFALLMVISEDVLPLPAESRVLENALQSVSSGIRAIQSKASSVAKAMRDIKAHVDDCDIVHEEVRRLGTYAEGNDPRNFWRALNIPVDDKYEVQTLPMLDPHSVIAYLWNIIGVQVPSKDVQTFWHHSRQHRQPWALEHPATDRHIPIGIYGDAAKIPTAFNADKILGIFINLPLWRPTSIRASRFLIFAVEESKLWGTHTLSAVLERIVWSLNLLFEGKRPTVDPQGNDMPDPFKFYGWVCRDKSVFALTEIRGDQLWHKQIFRFSASWVWTSQKVCHACDARAHGPESQDRLYFNFDAWIMLCEEGIFGDPELAIKDRLVLAYRASCLGRLMLWLLSGVLKKNGDVLLTAKAYNNRIILEWLASELRKAVDAGNWKDKRLPLAARALHPDQTFAMSLDHMCPRTARLHAQSVIRTGMHA
ncbi:unnamed protein product, partial [Symbiodinium sp. CCMP2456]